MSRRRDWTRPRYDRHGHRFENERKVHVFCTGRGSHDRWNAGYILLVEDPEKPSMVCNPRGGCGTEFQHFLTRQQRQDQLEGRPLDLDELLTMPDGTSVGPSMVFDCGRCQLNLPIRKTNWQRVGEVLTAADAKELDLSRVSLAQFK